MINDVAKFHKKYGIDIATEPSFLSQDLWEFRIRFLYEELQEMQEAHKTDDMHGVADAIIDLVYVALGTADCMGLTPKFQEMWDNVQRANMAKVRATSADQSKRGSTHDVVKPEGWKAPDHTPQLGSGPWPRQF